MPKFNQSLPSTAYAIERQNTVLKCHVIESVPRVVKFEFVRNGEVLSTNGHYVVNSFLNGQDFAELLITNVTEDDFGEYTCRVSLYSITIFTHICSNHVHLRFTMEKCKMKWEFG